MACSKNFREPAHITDSRKKYIDKYCKEIFHCEPRIYKAKLEEAYKDEKNMFRRVDIGVRTDNAEEKVILTIGALVPERQH